jgi:hypothetical protein
MELQERRDPPPVPTQSKPSSSRDGDAKPLVAPTR